MVGLQTIRSLNSAYAGGVEHRPSPSAGYRRRVIARLVPRPPATISNTPFLSLANEQCKTLATATAVDNGVSAACLRRLQPKAQRIDANLSYIALVTPARRTQQVWLRA
ncbi:hypothetical protein EVAR_14508_1 [Eumeta japonica]|uniref:Uncharacterized protein n=1 Tax=Eumeta variegata TaxID=151549 RepID=A0A4C1U385_EUMVA|nr:hypothetical protein EVAR_14508_1 [Eumeta japonica]